MTQNERVWQAIKDAGEPVTTLQVAERLGLTCQQVYLAVSRMRKSRVRIDSVSRGLYVIPRGEKFPLPGKGSSPNSRKNLVTWNWQRGLEIIQARRKPGLRYSVPKPKPATELERCWLSMKRIA